MKISMKRQGDAVDIKFQAETYLEEEQLAIAFHSAGAENGLGSEEMVIAVVLKLEEQGFAEVSDERLMIIRKP